ncbi:allophanate hydrolase [Halothiobacillus sp. DCM-1]|uniref:allophanate hydrolase n=1 Tax=Halothiobacillus sp. DCM-1 TaxID=3112558 RepID=UPI003252650F
MATPDRPTNDQPPRSMQDWQSAWREDFAGTAAALLAAQAERIRAKQSQAAPAWISLTPLPVLEAAIEALKHTPRSPVWGVPFAVKDNIDVAGLPTTAACPAFAYEPTVSAPAVERLQAAGALCLGKTNLDQFATGLNGTRSPYGIPSAVGHPAYISGGSSSGSAVVVAQGEAAFALGTDTAGSGRVPAAFNGLIGLKPTKGWVSTRGVVPACRTLDCVTVFAHTLDDAETVLQIIGQFDAADPYARPAPANSPRLRQTPRLATFAALDFFGDDPQRTAWLAYRQQLEQQGIVLDAIDPTPFLALAPLLYQGPWVAERLAAIAPFMATQAEAVHPVVRQIIEGGQAYSAVDTFQAEYQRAELSRQIRDALAPFDALLLPTAPIFPTIDAVLDDPITLNSQLGTYTNFVNLADLCALAIPAGQRPDGLPFGVTLMAPAWHDGLLGQIARRLPGSSATPDAPAPLQAQEIALAVVGAHLSGMPLNPQLTDRGGRLLRATTTAPSYRLYALANTTPPKPGLVFAESGAAIAVEVWALPRPALADFLAEIPAPLGLGQLTLADGSQVIGFICEPRALTGALDITEFSGWRAYRAAAAHQAQDSQHV